MRKNILILVTVCVMSLLVYLAQTSNSVSPKIPTLVFNGHTLTLELADLPEIQTRGLGGHAPLSNAEGMLFRFGERATRTFWMKDMAFPIDIVWLWDCNGERAMVVGIENSVDPQIGSTEYELKLYTSPEPVSCVLETRAGLMKQWGVVAGSMLETKNLTTK